MFKFLRKFIFPILAIALISILKVYINRYLTSSTYLLYTVPIILFAWFEGVIPSSIAGISTLIFANYLFLDPKYSFKLGTTSQLSLQVLFFIQIFTIIFLIKYLNTSSKQYRSQNRQLTELKNKLTNILDSIFTLIVIVDRDGRILEVNKAIRELSFDVNDIGERISDTHAWSYSEQVQSRLEYNIRKALESGNVTYDEAIRIGANDRMDVLVKIVPVIEDSEVKYIVVSLTDITERKSYEKELERIKSNYNKLINSNIIGMSIVNNNGQIIDANDAFLNMLGYTQYEMKNGMIELEDLYEDVNEGPNEVGKIMKHGFLGPLEKDFKHKLGENVPTLFSAVLLDSERGTYISLVHDLTERKKIEQNKDDFISIASHELKTPLTTLKGYVQLFNSSIQKRYQETFKFVGRMDSQMQKLMELINNMLDVSTINTGVLALNKEDIDIVGLIREIIAEIAPLNSKHEIILLADEKEIFVQADRFRITQVIVNLLNNAIKYSPNATRVNVYISIDGNKVKVTVEDFGVGISKGNLDKIFNKFYRVTPISNPYGDGMGLGLYISSQIIAQHKGDIGVQSKEEVGSKFFFTLPLLSL